jgi:hypothetical protein
MTTFAVLLGTQVINIIDAPSLEVAEEATGHTCIEYTDYPVSIGDTYDGNVFTTPVIDETTGE